MKGDYIVGNITVRFGDLLLVSMNLAFSFNKDGNSLQTSSYACNREHLLGNVLLFTLSRLTCLLNAYA